VFGRYFQYVVPFGDYYKKAQVIEIINAENIKPNYRERMLDLLELIPVKKSLHLAQKELNYRNMDKIMGLFAELGVSPVTLSKRYDGKRLESLYSYLRE
jgi:hypothetical protein